MNYIINPYIFYWMSVLDYLKGISLIIAVLSGVALVIVLVWYFLTYYDLDTYGGELDEDDEAMLKPIRKLAITSSAVLIISTLTVIFVPSKNTLIEMLIARLATVENANWTVESLKSVVDYIVEAFKAVK